jgi:phage N-6-adenine-methyltransferase
MSTRRKLLAPIAQESAIRTPNVPSLDAMIEAGRASAEKIKRASRESLVEWFAQSERLNIARKHYKLRGAQYLDFAQRMGVDRTSAYELVKLHQHRANVMSRCLDELEAATIRGDAYAWPGWRTALEWYEGAGSGHRMEVHHSHQSDEHPTPQYLFDWLNERLGPFDLDVAATAKNAKCKRYFTKEQDALKHEWRCKSGFMNPPFSLNQAFCRMAYQEVLSGRAGSICGLLPNHTSSDWFQDYCAQGQLLFGRGRIRFEGSTNSAPFGSMLVVWNPETVREGAPHGLITASMFDWPKRAA